MLADAHDDPINTIIGLLILFKRLRLLFCGWPCMKQMWTVWSLPHLLKPAGLGFFLNKAARIYMIVAVIKLCCNLSLLDGRERKVKGTRKQATKTKHKKKNKQTNYQRVSLTNRGEKVKQAQALTAVYTSPALTSSSAGNSWTPMHSWHLWSVIHLKPAGLSGCRTDS